MQSPRLHGVYGVLLTDDDLPGGPVLLFEGLLDVLGGVL